MAAREREMPRSHSAGRATKASGGSSTRSAGRSSDGSTQPTRPMSWCSGSHENRAPPRRRCHRCRRCRCRVTSGHSELQAAPDTARARRDSAPAGEPVVPEENCTSPNVSSSTPSADGSPRGSVSSVALPSAARRRDGLAQERQQRLVASTSRGAAAAKHGGQPALLLADVPQRLGGRQRRRSAAGAQHAEEVARNSSPVGRRARHAVAGATPSACRPPRCARRAPTSSGQVHARSCSRRVDEADAAVAAPAPPARANRAARRSRRL